MRVDFLCHPSHLLRYLFFLQLSGGYNLYVIAAVTVIAIYLMIMMIIMLLFVVRVLALAHPIFDTGGFTTQLVLLLGTFLPDPSPLHPVLLNLAHETLQPAPELPRVALTSGHPILGHVGVVQEVRPIEPFLGVLHEKARQKRLHLRVHVFGILDVLLDNQIDEAVDAVCVEGRLTDKELIKYDPEAPKIGSVVVGLRQANRIELAEPLKTRDIVVVVVVVVVVVPGFVPVLTCSLTSSGLMYSGVPLIDVSTIVLDDMVLANPKSQSFTTPLAERRMFWGFMSRWITLWECK